MQARWPVDIIMENVLRVSISYTELHPKIFSEHKFFSNYIIMVVFSGVHVYCSWRTFTRIRVVVMNGAYYNISITVVQNAVLLHVEIEK